MRPGRFAALALLALGLAGRSEAAFITYGPDAFSFDDRGGTTSIMFPDFDPTLGQLTEVTYNLTANTAGSFQAAFENLASRSIQFGFFPIFAINVVTPTLSSLSMPFFPPGIPPPNSTLGAYKGVENFMGSDSETVTITSVTDTETRNYGGSGVLAGFLGTGMVTASLTSSIEFYETSNPTGFNPASEFVTSNTSNATFSVTYTYVTPEPSSLVLLALGGSGALGFARRRR